MTKLFFTKILQGMPYIFFSNKNFRTKGLSVVLPDYLLYYLSLHVKLATSARSSQLVEMFAYENPTSTVNRLPLTQPSNPLVVYQFHNLYSQERLFLFATSLKLGQWASPKSLNELFSTASWLEREVGEMHGICFEGKKDLRNLMLQYGDSSAPFRKSYPSIGVKEVYFDSVTDTLIQAPVSIQI